MRIGSSNYYAFIIDRYLASVKIVNSFDNISVMLR